MINIGINGNKMNTFGNMTTQIHEQESFEVKWLKLNEHPEEQCLMNENSQSVDTQRTFVWVGDAITATHWRIVQRTRLSHTHPTTGGLQ